MKCEILSDAGDKGAKGDRGQADDTRNELETIDENIREVQRNMSMQFGKLTVRIPVHFSSVNMQIFRYATVFRNVESFKK